MKACCRCKKEKTEFEFNFDKFKRDGLSSYCRVCANEKKKDPNKKWKKIKRHPWVEGDICYIPMTGDGIAICDADCYDLVKGHQWRKDGPGYCCMQINRRTILLHRWITPDVREDEEIDHKNHDLLDNRRCNIRKATSSQNMANIRINGLNTSGFKGVTWDKDRLRWQAQIKKEGKVTQLGVFFCIIKAALAYNTKAIEIHGEFAHLNVIPQKKEEIILDW